jgi:hypothetical protein
MKRRNPMTGPFRSFSHAVHNRRLEIAKQRITQMEFGGKIVLEPK